MSILNALTLAQSDINHSINFPLIIIKKEGGVLKIDARTNEGWQAIFMPSQNFSQQLDNLKIVLREKLKNRENLEYIDLRFGNRVFYKTF